MFSAWKKSSQSQSTQSPNHRLSHTSTSSPVHRVGINASGGVNANNFSRADAPTAPLSPKKPQALPNGWSIGFAKPINTSTSPPPSKSVSDAIRFTPTKTLSTRRELNVDISSASASLAVNHQGANGVLPPPISPVEQYWAARALKAEALLGAQERHREELKAILEQEDSKRQREIAALEQHHREKHASLERLITILISSVFILISVIIYLSIHTTSRNKRSSMLHFTIPVLSPFTSVVENETSVMGTKALVGLFLTAALLIYMLVRHRGGRISKFL
ncbi:hypothetical protein AX16_004867 [Volvariella volvacea WC 439]|nr:hypothetical protein AX16_004867 [Volvariella volvacea WC 439]